MSKSPPATESLTETAFISVGSAFSSEDLTRLIEDIIASGELGRSKVYADLLRFLIDNSGDGRGPKEIEIAFEVLGKDTDFDVTKDSAVRVYIHQLRKKLNRYYLTTKTPWEYRIAIPKGQYMVVAEPRELPVTTSANLVNKVKLHSVVSIGLCAAVVLLAFNLGYWLVRDMLFNPTSMEPRQNALWGSILTDDQPIIVVLGDYYIFAELDKAGNVSRMVRDFAINSRDDLEMLFNQSPTMAGQYFDLDLTYLPEGSAYALNSLLPLLNSGKKPVAIKMMSELTTVDVQSSHIIYAGYISGLSRLDNVFFSASRLRVGENFDELIDTAANVHYVSDAGMPGENRAFVDYGVVASFSLTQTNRLVVVAGLRDAGLTHAAYSAVEEAGLTEINKRLTETDESDLTAFEALYEVRGVDRTNFSSNLIFASPVKAERLWDGSSR